MDTEFFADLAARSQAGDSEALEQLLIMAHTPVAYLCAKLLQNERAAAALTRDILKSIPDQLEALQDPAEFEVWICRITAARCMKILPRLQQELPTSDTRTENVKIPAKSLNQDQSAQVIQQMTDNLPDETRLCLLLYCCGSVSIPGIARLSSLSEDAVLDHLERAQGLINNQLRKYRRMGIRFAGISFLPDLMRTAMYNSADPKAAAAMVDRILPKPSAAPIMRKRKSAPVSKKLLSAVIAAALLLLLMLIAIFFLESARQ